MGSFTIEGPTKLEGRVEISGAKNEALKLIPLCVALGGKLKIKNVPKINDIYSQIEVFKYIGGSANFGDELELDSASANNSNIVCDASKSLRASVVFLGPLLSRFGQATLPFPGGCAIGQRPIDTHLDGFRDLGATTDQNNGKIAVSIKDISAKEITLKEKSVSATENILLYLATQDCEVMMRNCAVEPEIMHLIEILNSGGAKIEQVGEREFKVKGTKNMQLDEIEVMPDRIEAGTFLIALAATGGSGEIHPFQAQHLGALTDVLKQSGVKFEIDGDVCRVSANGDLKPFEISTAPYPGFPTDLQSPMALIAARAKGTSTIREEMFENRLKYLNNLGKMGLEFNIKNPNEAQIMGGASLHGADVDSPDLRAGITILIAAMMAEGVSNISNAQMIDRGYENIDQKLSKLGARIKRSDG